LKRQRRLLQVAAAAILALALVGCASPSTVGGPAVDPAATAAPSLTSAPSSPSPAATPGSLVVTLGDVDKTVTMHVGERFLLNLGLGGELEPYDWQAVPTDPSIVSRVPNVLTVRGSQGLYEAHKPGQTELTATGEAQCRQLQPPCAVPSRSFNVTVQVEP
jgi:hypothetical protein